MNRYDMLKNLLIRLVASFYCDKYDITLQELKRKDRTRQKAVLRNRLAVLLDALGFKSTEIAELMNRNHSTILMQIQAGKNDWFFNKSEKSEYEQIKEQVQTYIATIQDHLNKIIRGVEERQEEINIIIESIKVEIMKIKIKNVRFSYAHVFEPHAMDAKQEPKYSVSILIGKDDPQVPQIQRAIEETKKEYAQLLGARAKSAKSPLRDGDVDRPGDLVYSGKYFINASCKIAPSVSKIVRKSEGLVLEPITSQEEFYSGCYGAVSINFFGFNTSGNVGIAAGLNHIVKTQDGQFLGGRVSAQEEFKNDLVDLAGGEMADDDLPM